MEKLPAIIMSATGSQDMGSAMAEAVLGIYAPAGRLNIRYQRMFAGAFMYAGGLHIGIEWPQFKEMVNGKPVRR